MMDGNLTSLASNLTAILHQVPCNGSFLGCVDECGAGFIGFDHVCAAERGTFASSMTLLCRPCDYSTCDVNVSLILGGFESIEGVFLSRIPRFRECNQTAFEDEVRVPGFWHGCVLIRRAFSPGILLGRVTAVASCKFVYADD